MGRVMESPTLEDAKTLIERTKVVRPTCGDCSVILCQATFQLLQGKALDLPGLNEALTATTKQHLKGQGWESVPHMGDGLIKRCAKCADALEFPWADRLDAEKVLAFMTERQDRAFWLGDLEATL
jgi:hypothetical protein